MQCAIPDCRYVATHDLWRTILEAYPLRKSLEPLPPGAAIVFGAFVAVSGAAMIVGALQFHGFGITPGLISLTLGVWQVLIVIGVLRVPRKRA